MEVLQGNYLIHLDQPQGGRHFFEANEKFFIGEHTPLPEAQAEPIKVLPPCTEPDKYEVMVEVTIGAKGFPTVQVKPGFRGTIVF